MNYLQQFKYSKDDIGLKGDVQYENAHLATTAINALNIKNSLESLLLKMYLV